MNRVAIVRTADGKIHALNQTFDDEAQLQAECDRRDKLAGHKLSPLTLMLGIPDEKRREDRNDYTRMTQATFSPVFAPVEVDPNPYRSAQFEAAKTAAFGDSRDSRKAFFRKAEEAEDARLEREEAVAAEKDQRAAAVAYAQDFARDILWDASYPRSMAVAARNMLQQASTPLSSFDHLKAMSVAAVTQQRQHLAERRDRAAVEQAVAAKAFEAASFVPHEFGGTPGLLPGEKAVRMRDADGSATIMVLDGNRVVKQWPESEAPAPILEAANNPTA